MILPPWHPENQLDLLHRKRTFAESLIPIKLVNPKGGFMMKRNFLAYGFISGFALFLSLGSQPAKATDWFQQGRELIERNGNDIYHNVVSPVVMQYHTYTIPSNQVQSIKNQFRAAAGGARN
jgi:hypothetical protein